MAEYQKYMFDNFIVETNKEAEKEPVLPDVVAEDETVAVEAAEQMTPQDADTGQNETEVVPETETIEALEPEPVQEEAPQPEIAETLYTEDELNEAVSQAKAESYEEGRRAAEDEETKKQNILLEEIKNQLMMIFAGLENKAAELEKTSLEFAAAAVRKVLPTLEKERAEAEVKTFLADNFANFSAQESLSFAFHPDTVALVANSLGRLAEQNDFEGKIAVHKDVSLGPSDCRVEWKNGGVERVASKILGKIDNMVKDNTQERENG